MTAATFRTILRWGHIAAAAVIGTYLYSPWGNDPAFTALIAYGVFPAMAVSGLLMWQQGRVMRMFTRRRD